ncbi:MAG: trypsin-like peptidase domain-containing protein [Candidatus Pacebacteria bacterium]|nr:trypsin-like peptidase domain-containing protein [Candidatus Paceibacterota bacterium]
METSQKQNKYAVRFFLFLAVFFLLGTAVIGGAGLDRYFKFSFLDDWFPRSESGASQIVSQRILNEESRVIEVVEKVGQSVVTINISKKQVVSPFGGIDLGPFGFFGPSIGGREEQIEQDIGSGFIISSDGLIVTNRHVVEDREADYKVITSDDQTYEVEKIYRDQVNDLAILKINGGDLKPVELGDSDKLKVGQFVIAIGTALGEFRTTVTTGVISGLGRGITAGSPFEGYVEQIDNVIQTDAAINPGNSGGPLLNSLGQVIGVNVAVAPQGENIAFAIPIDVIKESLDNFNDTGQFSRPFLGVRYRMVGQDLAIMAEVPQGAYIEEVIVGTPAEAAGLKAGDIITRFEGQPVRDDKGGLAKLINQKKVNSRIRLTVWRNGSESEIEVVLKEVDNN